MNDRTRRRWGVNYGGYSYMKIIWTRKKWSDAEKWQWTAVPINFRSQLRSKVQHLDMTLKHFWQAMAKPWILFFFYLFLMDNGSLVSAMNPESSRRTFVGVWEKEKKQAECFTHWALIEWSTGLTRCRHTNCKNVSTTNQHVWTYYFN